MLVPREHLPNAISLNSVMVQAASVAGPALGGPIIAIGGVGWAYVFNAVSFLVRRGRAADDARRAEDRSLPRHARDAMSVAARATACGSSSGSR